MKYKYSGCYYKLESVTIPNSVTSIGAYAFQNCSALSSIVIGNGVTSIGPNAFEYTSLLSVVIPEGVKTIGNAAFSHSGLKTVVIPSSVTSIGSQAFRYCGYLESVISYMEHPNHCDSYMFYYAAAHAPGGRFQLTVPYGTTEAYATAGWPTGNVVEMSNPYEATIGSAGFATFCSTKNLDFSGRDDVKAYIVSMFRPSTGEVTLTRVTDVPANTGLVLKGAEGTYDIPVGTGETVMANMLVGVTNDTQLNKEDGEYTNYILAKKSGETGFFAVTNGSTLGANKAYLPLPTASLPSSAKIRVIFEDEAATGIETTIEPEATQDEGIYYNLQGQRVEQPTRGIYIVNGKKIWIK